jgi:ATP-dependent DNA helicase RecQ
MEKKAFAVLLTNPSDIKQAENQFIHILPDKKFLNEMYNKLCNFFKLLMEKGSTKDSPLTWIILFDISSRSIQCDAVLDRQGIITLSQEFSEKFCYNLYSF